MKVSELKIICDKLIAKGLENYEVEFALTDRTINNGSHWTPIRVFNNIELADIGYSAEVVSFTGGNKNEN